MILTRYLYREIITLSVTLLSVLMLIFLSIRLIRYLAQASAGTLPGEFIFKLLGLKILVVLVVLLPLAFFLAVLLVLGRMYADQEITIMAACGAGLPFLLQRILLLAMPVALLMAFISLYLAPWANQQFIKLEKQAHELADISGIAAGRFKQFNSGKGFFFVEAVDENKQMQQIFAAVDRGGSKILLAARRARQTYDSQHAARYMILEDGYRYEGQPGWAEFEVTRFARHTIRIDKPVQNSPSYRSASPTAELWDSTDIKLQSELQLRLSVPIAVLLLAPLAVLMTHSGPRSSRYGPFFAAIVLYFIYNNALKIAQSWMENGDLSVAIGLWWVHGIMLSGVLLLLFIRRRTL